MLGIPLGTEDGWLLGIPLGTEDGWLLGIPLGTEDGCLLGIPLGTDDGNWLGSLLGDDVGLELGWLVGSSLVTIDGGELPSSPTMVSVEGIELVAVLGFILGTYVGNIDLDGRKHTRFFCRY